MLFTHLRANDEFIKTTKGCCGISMFSDNLSLHTPCRTTQRHHRLLYHELEKLLKVDAVKAMKKTNSTDAIHQISECYIKINGDGFYRYD